MIYKKKIFIGVTLFAFSAMAIAANTTSIPQNNSRATPSQNSEKVKIEDPVIPAGARIVAGEDENEFYILDKDEPSPIKTANKASKPENKSKELLKNNNQRPSSEEIIIGNIDTTIMTKPIGINPADASNETNTNTITSPAIRSAQPEQETISIDKTHLTKPSISNAKPNNPIGKVTSVIPNATKQVTSIKKAVAINKIKHNVKHSFAHATSSKSEQRKPIQHNYSHKQTNANKIKVTKYATKGVTKRKSKADLITTKHVVTHMSKVDLIPVEHVVLHKSKAKLMPVKHSMIHKSKADLISVEYAIIHKSKADLIPVEHVMIHKSKADLIPAEHFVTHKSKADLIPVISYRMVEQQKSRKVHKAQQAKSQTTDKHKLVNKTKHSKVKVAANKAEKYLLQDGSLGSEIY